MNKRVLITLDGNRPSETVLGILGDVCQDSDELLLLCVTDTEEATLAHPSFSDLHEYLESHAARLRAKNYQVETRVSIDSHPAAAIIHVAKKYKPNLIAMATHSRIALGQLLFGSVASAVVHSHVAPVLLLNSGDP